MTFEDMQARGYFYQASGKDSHRFNGTFWRRWAKHQALSDGQGLVHHVYQDQDSGSFLGAYSYHAHIDDAGHFWVSNVPAILWVERAQQARSPAWPLEGLDFGGWQPGGLEQ